MTHRVLLWRRNIASFDGAHGMHRYALPLPIDHPDAADIGLVPVATLATTPRLRDLLRATLSSKGKVRSILLFRLKSATRRGPHRRNRQFVACLSDLCPGFVSQVVERRNDLYASSS